ncbi:YHS domain-containing (seleno)protein [Legionella tunisiensis]|uniref:YHS domain-containing (seleno)protein n=1 Tax=Legionella tunisiensis TaxID=1034944 RepID=UPI0002FC31A6|nr:YHS domain-containing (seleno)protein [Legionella tunisiensis]
MNSINHGLKNVCFGIIVLYSMMVSTAFSADNTVFAVALQGYDPVAYFTENKPVKGNGDHVVIKDSIYYLFANENDKKLFMANPDKYLPQYGGWCAFGVSVGKKSLVILWRGKLLMANSI